MLINMGNITSPLKTTYHPQNYRSKSYVSLVLCNWSIDGSFDRFNAYFLHRFNLIQNLKTCWHYNLLSIRSFFKGCYGCHETSKACGVLDIKVISWPISIWCGVSGKLLDKNSKGFTLLSNNEWKINMFNLFLYKSLTTSHRIISNNGKLNMYGKN
jgi:hypothetical protein